MTNDQIVEMAQKAKASRTENLTCFAYEELIAFARLIAQRQREIDAGICDEISNEYQTYPHTEGYYAASNCAEAIRSQT